MIRLAKRLRAAQLTRAQLVAVCVALGGLAAIAAPLRAQRRTTLVVGVAEAGNGAPIQDAEVILPAASQRARTNWLGEARIAGLTPGSYEVLVRRIGFVAADVKLMLQGDSAGATFMLQKAVVALDTVRVRAQATLATRLYAAFDRRRRMGLGRFLGEEDLERDNLRDFALVAVSHFPGLMLVPGPGGQWQLASRHGSCGVDTTREAVSKSHLTGMDVVGQQAQQFSAEGSGARQQMGDATSSPSSCFSEQPCHVKLFLDDVPVAESDINIVRTEELYGVEYYATGNAPPRYRTSGAACGVMLLWSRFDGG